MVWVDVVVWYFCVFCLIVGFRDCAILVVCVLCGLCLISCFVAAVVVWSLIAGSVGGLVFW